MAMTQMQTRLRVKVELTTSSLSLVLPGQEVFKQITHELQRNILEGECGTVEKFEQIVVAFEVDKRRDLVVTKR